jgi:hypothetical protein
MLYCKSSESESADAEVEVEITSISIPISISTQTALSNETPQTSAYTVTHPGNPDFTLPTSHFAV